MSHCLESSGSDFRGKGREPGLRAAGALLALLMAAAAGAATAKPERFDGFKPQFNLGQASNGAVCEAKRSFDGLVVDHGGRIWNVTCRGWSNTLGNLYVFPASSARRAEAAWRTILTARTDCKPGGVATAGVTKSACATKAASLAYVVYRGAAGGQVVAGEGRAPIEVVLL